MCRRLAEPQPDAVVAVGEVAAARRREQVALADKALRLSRLPHQQPAARHRPQMCRG